MSDVLDALANLHDANEALQGKLEEKQLEIQGLWRGIARAHNQLHQAELEIQRQKLHITRLKQEQACGGLPDPMGTRVYLVEAAGRERSQAHMARFWVPCETLCFCLKIICNLASPRVFSGFCSEAQSTVLY